jgi:hypothetical protein
MKRIIDQSSLELDKHITGMVPLIVEHYSVDLGNWRHGRL